jgi:hypothetical protein
MTLSNDDLKTILNRIASPRCSIVAACAGVCGVASFYRLGSRTVTDWPDPGDPPMAFGDALKAARKIQALSYESAVRESAYIGQVIMHNGRPCYELDPVIVRDGNVDASPDELEIWYGKRVPYKLDEAGLPIEMRSPPPAALVQKLLASLLPGQYRDETTTNINVVDDRGGVLRLGQKKPAAPSPAAPAIDASFTEVPTPEPEAEPEPDDPSVTSADVTDEAEIESEPKPQPDITEPRSGDSPLVRALRERLRAGVKNPRPQGPVYGTAPDDRVPDDLPDHAVRPPRDDGERRTRLC